MHFRLSVLLLVGVVLMVGPAPIKASCGLSGCPVSMDSFGKNSPHRVESTVRRVSFDLDHHEGSYWQAEPRYEYHGLDRWILGGYGSFVSLDDGHNSESGMGNPVLFGQRTISSSGNRSLSVGTQLELALGDDEDGVAAKHTELVPYVSAGVNSGNLHVMGLAGYRHALESGHGHGAPHTHLFVNPHSDREFLYRVQVSAPGQWGEWTPDAFVDGQHAMEGENSGTGYLSAGAGVRRNFERAWSGAVSVECPISKPKRFESKLSATLTFAF